MIMCPWEGEGGADSITASASDPRCRTQASNFSLCRRSATSVFRNTVSIPNCLKHSAKSVPFGSLMLTRATRAEFFLPGRRGASVIPEAFCMVLGTVVTTYILSSEARFGKGEEGQCLTQRSYYPEWTEVSCFGNLS